MRRLLVAPLLLAAFALVTDPPPADAQPAVKPSEESFNTADGVRLKGLFHKSPNGAKQGDAVVMLLYPPGPEQTMLKGNWDPLIDKLTEEGFHVFRFDWRGHGGSTDIVDPLGDNVNPFNGFFVNNVTGGWNVRYVKGGGLAKKPNDIRVKGGITLPGYYPVFVNDLAAARMHLDQKNDNSEVNTSSVYVIGAGDTATLGMLWMASEWKRPATHPMLGLGLQYRVTPLPGVVVDPPAGADIAGAVWLSASRPSNVSEATVKGWLPTALKLRDNNKMLFLYGKDDKTAASGADWFYNKLLVAGGNKQLNLAQVEQTFAVGFDKTKLNGVSLLGAKDVNAEAKIVEYLKARQKDRVNMISKKRNFVSPYYVDLAYYGIR